jgi:hypothetical protein
MYGRSMYGRAKYGRSSGSIFSILVFDLINIVTNAKFSINASIKDILSIYTLFRQTITQVVQDILSISTLPVFQAFLKPPLRAIARLINSVRSTCNIKSDSVKGRVRQPENKGMVK